MNRAEFIAQVEKLIDSTELHIINEDEIKNTLSDVFGKNGVYFLFDENENVVYVGMVGSGKQTSFYHRMYGHSGGAHCKESWFSDCKTYKFKSFPDLDRRYLFVIERLMIFQKEQPIYNDNIPAEEELESIWEQITRKEEQL